jgi:hypothetical protein
MTDLDRLIDDVAREMTEAPASVGMRGRVLAVMDEAKASYLTSASYRPFARWAWLAAAAAVVVGAYLQLGSLVEPTRRTPPSSAQTSRGRPAAVSEKIVRSEPPAVAAVRSTSTPGRIRPQRERNAASTIAALPPLTGPNALTIAPLASGAHSVPALDGVAPLDVERLDIKPLALPH